MTPNFDHQEKALFRLIVELLDADEVEEHALRIRVASRGLTLGRIFMRFYELGLVEDRVVRAGFFGRLSGKTDVTWVRLTDAGRKLAVETFSAPPELSVAPAWAAPVELEPEISSPVDAEEPEPTAALDDPEPPALVEMSEPEPEETPLDLQAEPIESVIEASDVPNAPELSAADRERIEGMAELVGLLGFDLTEAGASLALARWDEGQSDSYVALEIVVTSIAHAARLSTTGTRAINAPAALLLIVEIERMFGRLVPDGLMDEDLLSAAVLKMRSFIYDSAEKSGLDDFLAEPFRGAETPALCPAHAVSEPDRSHALIRS